MYKSGDGCHPERSIVILSEAKDLRSSCRCDERRATAAILRFAQNDSTGFTTTAFEHVFPVPCLLSPIPCSLFPVPYSLFAVLLVSQGHHGIDFGGAAGGDVSGQERHASQR